MGHWHSDPALAGPFTVLTVSQSLPKTRALGRQHGDSIRPDWRWHPLTRVLAGIFGLALVAVPLLLLSRLSPAFEQKCGARLLSALFRFRRLCSVDSSSSVRGQVRSHLLLWKMMLTTQPHKY
jgi:hypothetical protein